LTFKSSLGTSYALQALNLSAPEATVLFFEQERVPACLIPIIYLRARSPSIWLLLTEEKKDQPSTSRSP